jgi:hypothetical protein
MSFIELLQMLDHLSPSYKVTVRALKKVTHIGIGKKEPTNCRTAHN